MVRHGKQHQFLAGSNVQFEYGGHQTNAQLVFLSLTFSSPLFPRLNGGEKSLR
jgi:hypothetical protein